VTLADRLRRALEAGHREEPELLLGDFRDEEPGPGITPAAVLVAVTDRPEPGVILTRRTEHLRRHPGQIAFPGGRLDPGDDGPIGAALREAEEEIALPPSLVHVVGLADRYRTGTGFDVTPVLGVVPPDLRLVPHEAEVAAVFEAPLHFLLDPANHREGEAMFRGKMRHYYEIIWDDWRIWGVTAAMIVNLSRRLRWTA
jgi:8-oxo-dGTP pyrophosphatase MutT (NUDIX family)